ncbi:hypothetical protein GHT06_017367 [Daphnia sinensis]|uniref:Uncharacterized protein n=1 Tax=Daphnia sinensis TaxID=1820382 RepID=A0AAD5KPS4_9CRUS|nr:hypothetical protein GHT06_017367 [Daphnia sinensis]
MDRDSLRSGGRRSGSRGSMQQRKPLSIPAATDTPTAGSAFDSCGLDAQSTLYESIDDDDIVYDQDFIPFKFKKKIPMEKNVIFSGHYLLDDGGELDNFSSPVQDRTLPDLSIAGAKVSYLSTA